MNYLGSKNGNRRTANVKSLGYSDLYSLRKEDLWLVLDNYPESLSKIIEKGKSILRKDNLLDESLTDSKRYAEQDQLLTIQNRVKKLIDLDESFDHRLTNFFETYIESIRVFKQQLARMEYRIGARKPSISLSIYSTSSTPDFPQYLNLSRQNIAGSIPRYSSAPYLTVEH